MTHLTEIATGDQQDPSPRLPGLPATARKLWFGWMLVVALLLPVLLAIWTIPGFVTQDGPAHLYNAWILSRSFDSQSPYQAYYEVRWQPLPNWAAHLALAGLIRVVSPWTADRVMLTVTLLGFPTALVWLRWTTRGEKGLTDACLLSVILSLNLHWIMGFTGFLLGCCVFSITLGVWWSGHENLRPARMLTLLFLLVLGYFCHLVSLGLAVLGLGFLALLAPIPTAAGNDWRIRRDRVGRTVLTCLPMLALGFVYLRLSRQGGPIHPVWETLADTYSLSAWVSRLGWVDPLSLAKKFALPFTDRTGRCFIAFAPVVWFGLGALLWFAGLIWKDARTVRSGRAFRWSTASPERLEAHRVRLIWLAFGLLLLIAGIAGPDSLGSGHGEYLPQRLELLGLAALVPAFDLSLKTWCGRLIAACLVIALCLQTLIVWDHALHSNRTAGRIIEASDLVGSHQRVATLLIRIRSRFRANSLLHADSWLGVETGNILWSNYETRHYYFPVQFRPGIDRPDPYDFERAALDTDPSPGQTARRLWERILFEHHGSIDKVVVWGEDPLLDEITRRWCDLESKRGEVRVFVPRSRSSETPVAP